VNTRRRMTGVVTSNKMDKTVVIEISRTFQHRLYKKVVHSRHHVLAHDELDCQLGDRVQIVESRPISRHKKWVVETILRRDIAASEPSLEELDAVLDAEEVTTSEPEPIEDESEDESVVEAENDSA
jgi:small subunit ribosomal protein S17